ncbi:MAG TPA: hypothetical protein VM778_05760 [Gemmatimonadota bacterium]|nr:hypothetical protein [Gemmatimonadota bacterium]
MRVQPPRRRCSDTAPLLVLALFVLLGPAALVAQSPSPPDSAALVEAAREAQRDFERFRQHNIPRDRAPRAGRCDRLIGRMCIWFGGEGEANFPPEPEETGKMRRSLIGTLLRARHEIADPWVVGQLVHYMVEAGEYDAAEQVSEVCGIEAQWWCTALTGYSLHVRGDVVAAEAAFRGSLAMMPTDERERWATSRYVLSEEGVEMFQTLEPSARERLHELFWRLSDPLFLVDGNDRLTDHFARLVEARNHVDAAHPHGLEWGVDLQETLIRYGRIVGWSRGSSPVAPQLGSRRLPQDNRGLVGHHHPMSRGYLFPEAFLESPADIPPESWISAPREARTWYAPPYAPDMRALETQVGRFRRGDGMLVVGAYRPARPADDDGTAGAPVEAGLFLVPEDGRPLRAERGDVAEGVFALRAPPGRYVSSLEVLDPDGRRAWRARQGVRQDPLAPGEVDVSDLLILSPDAPFPGTLEEAIPRVRPGIEVGRGERFTVVWEAYGLEVREPVQVTLGFTRGRLGFLERVGEFLGIIEPDRPVEVSFAETAPDEVESVFRAMVIELPDIDPGEYTLHLRLGTSGGEGVTTSRPVIVVEQP